MATNLALRNTVTASDVLSADEKTTIGGTHLYDLIATFGSASTTAVVDTAASGTEIQWTLNTTSDEPITWVSGRVPSGGFTLTFTFLSIWAHQSNMNANCGGRFRVFKFTPDGGAGTLTELGGGPFNDGVEFGTAAAEMTWTGNVTDTAFAENDRIVVKVYITNVGTMGGGHTCTLTFNAASAATGDSFFQIAENVTFKAEDTPPTAKSATDSGTLSQSVDLLGIYTATDTGTLAETVAVSQLEPKSVTDSATLSETVSKIESADKAATDSATASESLDMLASPQASDAGTLSESNTIAATPTVSDSGTLGESQSISATPSVSDTASMQEVIEELLASLSISDSGTLSEVATQEEVGGGLQNKTATDTGTLAEAVSVVGTGYAVSDSGTLAESVSVVVVPPDSEGGASGTTAGSGAVFSRTNKGTMTSTPASGRTKTEII